MYLTPHITRDRMRGENVDNWARGFYEFVMPPVDVAEDGSDLIASIDLPGFEKSNIKIKIVENKLSINARREVIDPSGSTHCRHRPINISRTISLPISSKDYENKKVIGKATYVDGVITLRIPLKNRGSIDLI